MTKHETEMVEYVLDYDINSHVSFFESREEFYIIIESDNLHLELTLIATALHSVEVGGTFSTFEEEYLPNITDKHLHIKTLNLLNEDGLLKSSILFLDKIENILNHNLFE